MPPIEDPSVRMRRDLTSRADAIRSARESFEQFVHLVGMRQDGKTLTSRQNDEFRAAQVHFNDAARSLGLEEIRDSVEYSQEGMDLVVRTLYAKEERHRAAIDTMDRGDALRTAVHARIGDVVDYSSGRPYGAPSGDEIRDMLQSRERQHDFDYPSSEAFGDEMRAISDGANGAALYMNDFAKQVAIYARTESPWLGLATVLTADNGRPLVVPQLTGDVTVYTPGEGTAITASDGTLASVTVSPTGFKALTLISREAYEDQEINLSSVLARSHARAIGLAFGSTFTTAVLAGISNGGTASGIGGAGTATVAFYGYEDLIDVQYSRAAPYRTRGVWIMANGAIKKTRKFRDGQGQYLWPSEDLVAGQPVSLLGGNVYEDPNLAGPASATKSVVYGDVAAGLLIKATQMRVEMSTDYLFNTDQIAIKTVQRIAGGVQDAAALAFLVSANS